jgi:ribosomal protein S18 acetylase RimI-like enzyme
MYKFEYDVDAYQFLDQAEDLLKEHWEELALNKENIKLNTDRKKYKQLQELNVLKNIVVYKEDKIVGYSVILNQPHLHYCDHNYAYVDVIYVSKDHRNGSVGAKLLLATEQLAKNLGASVVLHHAKPYVPMIIKPLERLGYSLYEQIYGKYIGE